MLRRPSVRKGSARVHIAHLGEETRNRIGRKGLQDSDEKSRVKEGTGVKEGCDKESRGKEGCDKESRGEEIGEEGRCEGFGEERRQKAFGNAIDHEVNIKIRSNLIRQNQNEFKEVAETSH
jgi:hypothetical protein